MNILFLFIRYRLERKFANPLIYTDLSEIFIDNIVNGEVNLPPGEHTKLFERIRDIGKGYTVIGTNYTYNSRNQLVHLENLTRYEEYDKCI